MEMIDTGLKDVKIIKLQKFGDHRGFFLESYHQGKFDQLLGARVEFVQDNHSRSAKNVLRGLHYQLQNPQAKLVRAVRGEIYDVVVDIRKSSPTFGKWIGVHLSEDKPELLYVPPGFAHGFVILSDMADVMYKVSTFYHQPSDRTLLWNDPDIGIQWPHAISPILSEKDTKGKTLKEAECFS